MAYLQWQENLSVGVETLDADHRKLVDLINQVYEAMAGGDQQAVVARVLDELIDYTHYHFDREEDMLRDRGYPDYEKHKEVHRAMVQQVEDLKRRFQADPASVPAMDAFDFLSRWLIQHIVGTDLKYRPYLEKE